MANIIKRIQGNELLQTDLPYQNFIASAQGGLEFNPVSPDDSEMPQGFAYSTYHPLEGNVTWIKAEARWTYSNPATPPVNIPDAQALITLYGLMPDGSEHLIGESVWEAMLGTNSTPVQKVSFFDLKSSGGQPPLYLESSTGGTTGTVKLHLPFRVQNVESCNMHKSWMDPSYTDRNMHSLKHWRTWNNSNVTVGPLYIQTTPGMDDLQRDVSFADGDGKTGLCFYRDVKDYATPGQRPSGWNGYSLYWIKIPYLPSNTTWKYIFSYFGGQGANPTDYSNGHNTFFSFDDWEDGLYTGRTAPYTNWTSVTGSPSIQSTTPLSGNYSLKIVGPGVGTSDAQIGLWKYLYLWPYIAEFDYRITNNNSGNVGTDTYTPYVGIWYMQYKDSNNFVRFDTYYDSGNSTQWLRLCKWQGGVFTEYQKTGAGGRHGAGTGARIRILDDWDGHVQVWWDQQLVIDTYYTVNWGATYKYGFGAMRDSAGNWDNFKFYQPFGVGTDHVFTYEGERWGNSLDCGVLMEDDFNDNSLDANKWVAKLGTGASTPVETNQELRVSGTGTYRSAVMTKYPFRAPYTVFVDAKKSENIEVTLDWAWGGVNNSYFGSPNTGYTFRYASWQNPTRFEVVQMNPTSPYTNLLTYANYTLDSNYHNYRIERTMKAIYVYIDGAYLLSCGAGYMINTLGYKGGYVGLSARETPAAVNAYYDNFKVGGYLKARETDTYVTPTSYTAPSQYLNYTTPAGYAWADGTPWHFRVKENQSGEYKTGDMYLSAKNLVKLGYDNVDKYVALRFKVEFQGRSDTPFTLDYIDYHYNVE